MADPQRPTPVERLVALAPVLVLVVCAASLVVPIASYGLWDPHELRAIDLARRIAVHWFGGSELVLEGVANSLPTRGEVDRGELPFSAMAVGLRLFGLSAWAGRLPLALIAVLGLVATYFMVSRLGDRVAAALSVLVLSTMPLYFVHARTLLGDGVTMASLAVAVAGFAIALFDRGPLALRGAAFALGLVGLVAGGLTRGLLLGVAVPALGMGLGWLVPRLAGAIAHERLTAAFGAALLVLGVASSAGGLVVLERTLANPERYFALLGFGYSPPAAQPTFDAVVHQLGHGLFPWSAILPLSLARLALPVRGDAAPSAPSVGLRASLVMVVAVAVTAWGGLAPFGGVLPFGAVAPLAVVVALVLRDFDLAAPPSRTFGMFAAAIAILLLVDFRNFPEELLNVFGLGPLKFPESFRDVGSSFFAAGTLGAFVLFFFVTQEQSDGDARAFDRDEYLGWFRTLRDLWNGNLLFALLVIEAAMLGFLAFDLLGRHVEALERFVTQGEIARLVAAWGFLVLPVVVVAPAGVMAVRDCFRLLDRMRTRSLGLVPRRGSLGVVAALLVGAALSLVYYPALADQLSPQESYEAFRRFARAGEPLGMVGPSGGLASHYTGRGVATFRGQEEAYRWLLEPGGRRFLVIRADSLAGLNARYRSRVTRTRNLPVLDAHSSEILLVSNQLRPGERSENPLDAYLLGEKPRPTRPLDANLGDQLDVLGWDVTDLDDRPVKDVVPGRRYRFVIFYEVVQRVSGAWETFVHIDGFQRRFNGDHKTLGGRYPFALWQVGDFIADRHEIELEPNFTPGTYQVYFGLYSGSRRLPVKRGPHHDDRIQGGPIVVR